MKLALYIIWPLAAVIYLRASFLAMGKIKRRFFPADTFKLGQLISTLGFAVALVLAILAKLNLLVYLAIINLIYTFLFYLQPTPRTTNSIAKIFILTNLLFALLIIFLR